MNRPVRSMLLDGPMARVAFSGYKTQARAVLRPQPPARYTTLWPEFDPRGTIAPVGWFWSQSTSGSGAEQQDVLGIAPCPYGVIGDRVQAAYNLLEITGLRVERLQDITEDDAEAEGMRVFYDEDASPVPPDTYTELFAQIWDACQPAHYRWHVNPWVWVIEFKRVGGTYNYPPVVAAAIRAVDGRVFSVPAPGRHHDVIFAMRDAGYEGPITRDMQGFILADGLFVRRPGALRAALKNKQTTREACHNHRVGLFSEDLW